VRRNPIFPLEMSPHSEHFGPLLATDFPKRDPYPPAVDRFFLLAVVAFPSEPSQYDELIPPPT